MEKKTFKKKMPTQLLSTWSAPLHQTAHQLDAHRPPTTSTIAFQARPA